MFASALLRVSCVLAAFLLAGAMAQAQPGTPPATTPVLQIQLAVHQHNGAAAIDVDGAALPNSAILITLEAKISVDLPIVTLNHFVIMSDAAGKFATTLPIAPLYTPTTEILVQAQTTGLAANTVTYIVGQPTGPPIVPLMDNFDFP